MYWTDIFKMPDRSRLSVREHIIMCDTGMIVLIVIILGCIFMAFSAIFYSFDFNCNDYFHDKMVCDWHTWTYPNCAVRIIIRQILPLPCPPLSTFTLTQWEKLRIKPSIFHGNKLSLHLIFFSEMPNVNHHTRNSLTGSMLQWTKHHKKQYCFQM